MASAASNNALRMESGKAGDRNALIGLAIVVLAQVIATQVGGRWAPEEGWTRCSSSSIQARSSRNC